MEGAGILLWLTALLCCQTNGEDVFAARHHSSALGEYEPVFDVANKIRGRSRNLQFERLPEDEQVPSDEDLIEGADMMEDPLEAVDVEKNKYEYELGFNDAAPLAQGPMDEKKDPDLMEDSPEHGDTETLNEEEEFHYDPTMVDEKLPAYQMGEDPLKEEKAPTRPWDVDPLVEEGKVSASSLDEEDISTDPLIMKNAIPTDPLNQEEMSGTSSSMASIYPLKEKEMSGASVDEKEEFYDDSKNPLEKEEEVPSDETDESETPMGNISDEESLPKEGEQFGKHITHETSEYEKEYEKIISGMLPTESPPNVTTEILEDTPESEAGTRAPLGEEVESSIEGNYTMIEDTETPANGEDSDSWDATNSTTVMPSTYGQAAGGDESPAPSPIASAPPDRGFEKDTPTTSPSKREEPLTFSPTATASEEENHWWDKDSTNDDNIDWIVAPEPTEEPTPRPTMLYTPMEEGDPLEEEEVKYGGPKEDVFYHGLGDGPVGQYLDTLESPEEMEYDHNVQVVAGVLLGVFMLLLLVTAHQVMNNPDGLCAGCCRLTNQCICCFIRIFCLPCRAICCKDDQSRSRRTHAPMRTPFPTDLELA